MAISEFGLLEVFEVNPRVKELEKNRFERVTFFGKVNNKEVLERFLVEERMDIEKKLSDYRARKRKEAYLNKANTTLKSFLTFRPKLRSMSTSNSDLTIPDATSSIADQPQQPSAEDGTEKNPYLRVLTNVLYLILWLTLLAISLKLEFGLVFLIVSALLGICLNTRTGPRIKDEVSAYSVFNENCESIDGTLKAEQFEREIRYGPASVR